MSSLSLSLSHSLSLSLSLASVSYSYSFCATFYETGRKLAQVALGSKLRQKMCVVAVWERSYYNEVRLDCWLLTCVPADCCACWLLCLLTALPADCFSADCCACWLLCLLTALPADCCFWRLLCLLTVVLAADCWVLTNHSLFRNKLLIVASADCWLLRLLTADYRLTVVSADCWQLILLTANSFTVVELL